MAKKKITPDNLYLVDSTSEMIELEDKKFRKQVLRYGKWNYGQGVFEVTRDLVSQLVRNWKNKVWQNIPVTRGHQDNQALEEKPELVAGYVVDLEQTENGLDAIIELENGEEIGKKYKDVSAGILESYEDHEKGINMGSVLTHIAVVVEPYIKGLLPFVALSDKKKINLIHLANNLSDEPMAKTDEIEEVTDVVETTVVTEPTDEVVAEPVEEVKEATEEVAEVTEPVAEVVSEVTDIKDETKSEVKAEAEVEPVSETSETTGEGGETSNVVAEPVAEKTELSESGVDLQKALSDTKERERQLAEKVQTLEAENLYNKYLSEGKIVPAVKEEAMQLLSAKSQTINLGESSKSIAVLFSEFLSKLPVIVRFGEDGITVDETEVKQDPVSKYLKPEEVEGLKSLYKEDWREKAVKIAEEIEAKEELVKSTGN